jgi:hypothetical protein
MGNLPARILRLLRNFAASLIFPAIAGAQFSKLDDVGEQRVKKLKPLKPTLVAVADFTSPHGKASPQGHYLAWLLSTSLARREGIQGAAAFEVLISAAALAEQVRPVKLADHGLGEVAFHTIKNGNSSRRTPGTEHRSPSSFRLRSLSNCYPEGQGFEE